MVSDNSPLEAGEEPSSAGVDSGAEPDSADQSTGPSVDEAFESLPDAVIEALGEGASMEEAMRLIEPGPTATSEDTTPSPDEEEQVTAEPEVTPTGEQGEKPAAEEESDPEPEDEPEPAPEPSRGKKSAPRLRLNGLSDEEQDQVTRAQKAVANGIFNSFSEAYAAISGKSKSESEAQSPDDDQETAEKPANQAPEVPEEVAAIDTQITEAESELDQANEDYDPKAISEAQKKLLRLGRERDDALRRAEAEARQREESQRKASTYEQDYSAEWESLQGEHAALKDQNSPLYQLVDDLDTALHARASNGNEDAKKAIENPRYLRSIVERAISVQGGQSAPAPNPNPASPRKPAHPVGALSHPSAHAKVSPAEAERLLNEMSEDEIDAALEEAERLAATV